MTGGQLPSYPTQAVVVVQQFLSIFRQKSENNVMEVVLKIVLKLDFNQIFCQIITYSEVCGHKTVNDWIH